ncbi:MULTISPECIES: hypothetical protein [Alteribacter]|uniref:Uncharacterized protein n=1 Tax=Alteribacter keqinensis TaxID=2483800 RepID=A0A3M7TYC2_9BACI|nr:MULTISPECIES: hypothetical protein [Alteribacter]MBM7096311.1 hypothetical protein [Alteribacter salitolerans]RNA70463.1 hypothetical protein EBO34_11235 [Alteribacter keqinensis]
MFVKREVHERSNRKNTMLEQLFPESFMRKYTDYRDFDEMVEASNICLASGKAQREIETCRIWSQFVREHTSFSGWREMRKTAAEHYSYPSKIQAPHQKIY